MADFAPLSFSIGKGKHELDPKLYDFMSFLGLVEEDAKGIDWSFGRKIGDKLERLYLWGKIKSNSDDHEKIKQALYGLQKKMGINSLGKTLVDEMWRYTMIDTAFQKKAESLSKVKSEKPKIEKKEDLRSPVGKQQPIRDIKPEKKKEEKPLEIKESPRGVLKSEPLDL